MINIGKRLFFKLNVRKINLIMNTLNEEIIFNQNKLIYLFENNK